MEFDRKQAEFGELIADQDENLLAAVESEIVPAISDEPAVGPVPMIKAEANATAPDPSALHHWIDDLHQWENADQADPQRTKLVEKLEGGAIDDMRQVVLNHERNAINGPDEQKGIVPDFIADSALEGAAFGVHEPGAESGGGEDDPYMVAAAYRPFLDGSDDAGFGGGGGGGGAGGAGTGGDGGGSAPGDPPPADDDPKKKKAKQTAAEAPTPPPPDKPAPAKPEKKGFFRKRSGDD